MTHGPSGWSWREFWLGLDRWLNTWFGGHSLETISARAGRAQHGHRWASALCWFLSWFERDHCQKAAHGVATPRPLTQEERARLQQRLLKRTFGPTTKRGSTTKKHGHPDKPPEAP